MSRSSSLSGSSDSSVARNDQNRQITPATSISEDDLASSKNALKRASPGLEETESRGSTAHSHNPSKRPRFDVESPSAPVQSGTKSPRKGSVSTTTTPRKTTLDSILKNPIPFVPASALTYNDERRISRANKFSQSNIDEHDTRRQLTLDLPNSWPKGERKRPAGLENPHNFCYRRSVLQMFLHAPVFCSWLQLRARSHALMKIHRAEARCLICDFAKLVTAVWAKSGTLNQSLRAVDLAIRQAGPATAYPWTANMSQADAHEFMSWLVDRFEHKAQPNKHTVQGLFKLRVLSEWTCQDCFEVHTSTPQDETGLSLSIKSAAAAAAAEPLSAHIARYFADEVSDARCANPACQSLRTRPRHRTVAAAPEVLFVQLQRFESTYSATTRAFKTSKITRHVPVPETLDLSAHAADAARREIGTWRYRLGGVVAHAGTLRFGHYISYAVGPDGRVAKFDDDTVSASSVKEMLRPEGSFTPYILTYLACEQKKST